MGDAQKMESDCSWRCSVGAMELQWKSILALRRRVVHSKRVQLQNQDTEAVASPF